MMHKTWTLALPTALLTAGCEELPLTAQPLTPASIPASAAYETMILSSGEARDLWLLPPSNAWAAYQKATILSSLDTRERLALLPDITDYDSVTDAMLAARRVALAGLPANAMWVVDLRGEASVAFAATLSDYSSVPVSPILTFNNWPAVNEVVPEEHTLAALLTMKPRPANSVVDGHPVFMLDSWRLAHRYEQFDAEVTDNRYMLTPSDLPDVRFLRDHWINHVIYVVEAPRMFEEDDLHETFLQYQEAGIGIYMLDLGELAEVRAPSDYYWRPLAVDPDRPTIVEDPLFFSIARGAFGIPDVIYDGWSSGG